jgi:hypothetical protein
VAFLLRRLEIGDIAFLFEDAGNLQLQLGGGNVSRCECASACLRPDRSTSSCASPPPPVCFGHQCLAPKNPRRRTFNPTRVPRLGCPTLTRFVRKGGRFNANSLTRTTSKLREFRPAKPNRGNTGGRSRTCADRRAGVRTVCSGYAGARKISTSVPCRAPCQTSPGSLRP